MRLPILLLGAGLICAAALAQPPVREPVREGAVERLVLDDGAESDAAQWVPAEATITVDKKHAKRGDTSLRFHIDVNWETGEKNYPVGWPRVYRKWPEALQNWSQYDYLDFSIFAESSRPALPHNPLGLILKGAGGASLLTRQLAELRLGEWTDFRLPLAEIPGANVGTILQLYISESDYKHGDVLDFWIDNISLVRQCDPSAAASKLPETAMLADARYVPFDLNLMGLRGDQKTDVLWQIGQPGRSAAAGKVSAGRGRTRIYLPMPAQGLRPGDYQLVVKVGQESLSYPLRVTGSPWQEAAK